MKNCRIDEYVIKDGKKHPFAVVCPGGGYGYISDDNEGRPIAELLNKNGVSAFVVFYRIGENAKFPNPQDDLANAISYIIKNADVYSLIKDNYSIWGFSAGGHLVASFGLEKIGYGHYGLPKPGLLVLGYPVISMIENCHEESRENLLGTFASEEECLKVSVEKNITAKYPNTFLWCGLADHVVACEHSQNMHKALLDNGIEHIYLEYEGIDHGIGLGIGLVCEEWFERAMGYWKI